MPRAEVGSLKWLSNKMKSKGLQRLRWYCQMCEKQCRDENGFKCHMVSETHMRQMQVFAQRPGKYLDDFSRSFEADFMRLMRTRYCRTRVLANSVYCEMIANKTHVHMNSTIWVTLSEFVRYLDRTGKCKVEESPRGSYISFIDPDKIAREELAAQNEKKYAQIDELEDYKLKKAIKVSQAQREELQRNEKELQQQSLKRRKIDEPLKLEISPPPTLTIQHRPPIDLFKEEEVPSQPETTHQETPDVPLHPLVDSDDWISEDLVVRVGKPGWEYDGRKGYVQRVEADASVVSLFARNEDERPTRLRLDKQFIESVIPKPGRWVRVCLGAYRGHEGRLLSVDDQVGSVALFYGPYWGEAPCDLDKVHKEYQRQLKEQENRILERGELVAEDLPLDAICRTSPPEEYEQIDVIFTDAPEDH